MERVGREDFVALDLHFKTDDGGSHFEGDRLRDLASVVGADDVFLILLNAREGVDVDEFSEGALRDVKEGDDGCAHEFGSCVCTNFEQTFFFVCGVDVDGLAEGGGAENDRLAACCQGCHLLDKVNVVLAWVVCDVNWSARDAAAGCVEAAVVVRGLEHVPVWQYVQVLGEHRVVGVGEDVMRMARWDVREEVV